MDSGSVVMVTIGGDSSSLVNASQAAGNALQQLQNTTNSMGQSSVTGPMGLFGQMSYAVGTLEHGIGRIGGAISGLMAPLAQVGNMFRNVFERFVMWRGLEGMQSAITQFATGLFDVNKTMEQNTFSWRFLFGHGNTPEGTATANSFMDWTKQFSMFAPYTRQDIIAAISTLGANFTEDQIKQLLPILADISSTQGTVNAQQSLQIGARALIAAQYGRSTMLRYDLRINPDELAKYGYDPNNPNSLIPALQAYENAKGETGAAKDAATQTFYGAWSSFIDRIQNLQITAGIAMFQDLKGALADITSWWDNNQGAINGIGTAFGDRLSSAVEGVVITVKELARGFMGLETNTFWSSLAATIKEFQTIQWSGIGAFFKGFSEVATGENIMKMLNAIREAFSDPNFVKGAEFLGTWLGRIAGFSFNTIIKLFDAIAELIKFIDTHQTAMQIFESIMIGLFGAVLIGLIPTIIAFTVALWSMAVAEAAALWPFLLIAVAIAAVSFAIMQLVQHWGQITKWLDNQPLIKWAQDTLNWFEHTGEEWMKALGQGIQNGFHYVIDQFNNLGNSIKKLFGHSTPEEGPLHGDDMWMPHMISGWAEQITAGTPMMKVAMQGVAQTMADTMNGGSSYGAGSSGGYGSNYATTWGDTNVFNTIHAAGSMEVNAMIMAAARAKDEAQHLMARRAGNLFRYGRLRIG